MELQEFIEDELLDVRSTLLHAQVGLARLRLAPGAVLSHDPRKPHVLTIRQRSKFSQQQLQQHQEIFPNLLLVLHSMDSKEEPEMHEISSYGEWDNVLTDLARRGEGPEGFLRALVRYGHIDVSKEISQFLLGKFLSLSVDKNGKVDYVIKLDNEIVVNDKENHGEELMNDGQLLDPIYIHLVDATWDSLQLGSAMNGDFIRPLICERPGCGQRASVKFLCKNILPCNLAAYCSDECAQKDWFRHHPLCTYAHGEPRFFEPCGVDSYRIKGRLFFEKLYANKTFTFDHVFEEDPYLMLWMLKEETEVWEPKTRAFPWGRTPARDLVELYFHEGNDYNQDLRICMTYAEDLRHALTTIIQLPVDYKKRISFTINEEEFHNQLRNIVIVMLSMLLPNGYAVELCTHIWYSYRLTTSMYEAIRKYVVPLFRQVNNSIKTLPPTTAGYTQVWKIRHCEIKVTFTKRDWFLALLILEPRNPLKLENAKNEWMHVMTGKTGVYRSMEINESVQLLPFQYRFLNSQYRFSGIFRPSSTYEYNNLTWGVKVGLLYEPHHFDRPNTLMFNLKGQLMMNPASNPTSTSDCLRLDGIARRFDYLESDIHGTLYFATREMLKVLAKRGQTYDMTFEFMHTSPTTLPLHLSKDQKFDRIDISCLIDKSIYPSTGTCGSERALKLYEPFLKSKEQNPSAYISGLFSSHIERFRKSLEMQMNEPLATRPDPLSYDLRNVAATYLLNVPLWREPPFGVNPALGVFGRAKLINPNSKANQHITRKQILERCVEQDELVWSMCAHSLKVEEAGANVGLGVRQYRNKHIKKDVAANKDMRQWPWWVDIEDDGNATEKQFWLRFCGPMKGQERLVKWARLRKEDKAGGKKVDQERETQGDVGHSQDQAEEGGLSTGKQKIEIEDKVKSVTVEDEVETDPSAPAN